MIRIAILSLVLISCASPKPKPKPDPVHKFKTRQEQIMDCYKMLRRMGEEAESARKLCFKLWERK